MTIINLTPHPVTIIRATGTTTYPACAPTDLPRATEAPVGSDMALTASDGQGQYENAAALASTGLVDQTGYTGVEQIPPISRGDQMFGVARWYIVSVVTAIGALAGGRGIEDLLVPMGQVRDGAGRIIGATGLAPATALLTPLYRAILAPHRAELMTALQERNEARRTVADLTRVREALDETMMAQAAQLERRAGGEPIVIAINGVVMRQVEVVSSYYGSHPERGGGDRFRTILVPDDGRALPAMSHGERSRDVQGGVGCYIVTADGIESLEMWSAQ